MVPTDLLVFDRLSFLALFMIAVILPQILIQGLPVLRCAVRRADRLPYRLTRVRDLQAQQAAGASANKWRRPSKAA